MVVRRKKIMKRRGVLIVLRAHRHFERSREIFLAERSSPDVTQDQDIVFPQRIHAGSLQCSRDPSATLGMTMPKNTSP